MSDNKVFDPSELNIDFSNIWKSDNSKKDDKKDTSNQNQSKKEEKSINNLEIDDKTPTDILWGVEIKEDDSKKNSDEKLEWADDRKDIQNKAEEEEKDDKDNSKNDEEKDSDAALEWEDGSKNENLEEEKEKNTEWPIEDASDTSLKWQESDIKETDEEIIKNDEEKKETIDEKKEKEIEEKIEEEEEENSEEEELEKKDNEEDGEENNKKDEKKEMIMDINITSIEWLINLLIDNKYDFLTMEPSENYVKISCQKDSRIVDERYIKYHIYSKILINVKQLTNLEIEDIDKEQEWKWIYDSKTDKFSIISKTVPSNFWEKVFLKASKMLKEKTWELKRKASLWKILWVLWAATFVTLILGWAFITFVVMNATDLEDVNFFLSLWISLNDINSFIWQLVFVIFSILLFLEMIFTSVYLFKFILTKKKFKKKKVFYAMIALVALIITFITGSIWMVVDKKIRSLPQWQELARWDVQIYDNDRLVSTFFEEEWALITDTTELIWPITIKYDLSTFEKKETRKWLEITKYKWNIDWKEIVELTPTLIREFTKKWTFDVSLIVEETWLDWKVIEKEVENISPVSITNIVEIEERETSNWWKIVRFDAEDLKTLGKIEWYTQDDLDNPAWKDSYIFAPNKVFFKESVVLIKILRSGKEEEWFDKAFIIKWDVSTTIEWEIKYEQSIDNDLEYELRVVNPETNFWEWFISEFEWVYWEKTVIKNADPVDLEESSKVTIKFNNYGDNEIFVKLKDSAGQYRKISTTVNIPKRIKLRDILVINNWWEEMRDVRYVKKENEYFIDELDVPTTLEFDARYVKPEDDVYTLDKVTWDLDGKPWIDKEWKVIEHEIVLEWNHTITVNYKFVHRKQETDVVNLSETIYIEAIKKEAILDLKIEQESDYVPMNVRFDASKSFIKDDDIVKFIYDYGDGVKEERDAINPWHKYTSAWDYEVKLTVVGKTGKSYSITKKLVLKPEPQKAKIWVSMKKAPVLQWIDFYSDESSGQIVWYFWDFWDGSTSTEANPTHTYEKVGTYTVKLILEFVNKNSLEDVTDIEIYRD